MKLHDERSRVKATIEDSKKYSSNQVWMQIAALDPETATAEDINKLMGYASIGPMTCDDCKTRDLKEAVQFNDQSGSFNFMVCFSCVARAMKLIATNKRKCNG